jgi:hypothetical protein
VLTQAACIAACAWMHWGPLCVVAKWFLLSPGVDFKSWIIVPLLHWPTPAVACWSVHVGEHVVNAHNWLALFGCTADPSLYCIV